ncbi:MAG: 2-C-methyl-D-erythritol 4-phosphate cytidylyltransferase, partial [Bacteroidota bacterium]
MKQKVIIVAGGLGKRMHTKTPKQFLKIAGEIILMRTIRIFHAYDISLEIIIT